MRKLLREPIVKFLVAGLVLYLGWLALYQWYFHPVKWLDLAVINNTIDVSAKILEWVGYTVERNSTRTLGIAGTSGLFIGDRCNGLSLFALFSIFIIAFPGKIISKIIFIPIGIAVIHALNILRVAALSIIQIYSYRWTELNHTYTFTIIIYACIFGMWLLWVNKFSLISSKRDTRGR